MNKEYHLNLIVKRLKRCYSNDISFSLKEKGWKEFFRGIGFLRFSKDLSSFKVLLTIENDACHYEAYLSNHLIYRDTMPLHSFLKKSDSDLIAAIESSDFFDLKKTLEEMGFIYKVDFFEKRTEVADNLLVYNFNPWNDTFSAKYRGKSYALDNIMSFDFSSFENKLQEDCIKECGAACNV